MLRPLTALRRWILGEQLSFVFERPTDPASLLASLRALGLRRIDRCTLTRNRTVMVSHGDGELRIHEAFLEAPEDVLRAVVRFIEGRTATERRGARQVILAYPVATTPAPPRTARPHPADVPLEADLARWHRIYNDRYFAGALREVPVRLSRRMRSRLGHYTAASAAGPAEIAISRRHLLRHGEMEALHTLLHEMVHQWQDETGRPIDHGRSFREKACEVGITPSARRDVAGRGHGRRSGEDTLRVRAARTD